MRSHSRLTLFVLVGLAVAAGLAFLVSPYASSSPDGLERAATKAGFMDSAKGSAVGGGPLADYQLSGVDNGGFSTGLAGLIGVATCFGLACGVGALMHRRHVALTPDNGEGEVIDVDSLRFRTGGD